MKRYVPLFVFLAFLGICAALFNSFYGDAKKNAIAELNSRQILHARQAAQSIEQYFDSWLQTLERLARNDHIIALDAAGKKTMGEVYNENRDKIRSITRVDRNGRIIDTVPFSQYAVGIDISYQQHVREIMRTHKPVVSEIFTTVQGFESIAVLVPMFKEGSYDGSIGILLKFREVARRYLEDIKIGETGYAWMITSGGIELYCPVQGHVGNSVFENCKDFPSIIAMAREMIQGKQGTTTYTFDKIRHDTVTEVTKHAVYMPINVGSTFWSLVVASSEEDVLASLVGFRNGLILIMALLIAGGSLFSYYTMRVWKIVQEDSIRTEVEQALRDSEERYRLHFQSASDVVYTVGRDLTILSVTPSVERLLGIKADQLMGRKVTDIKDFVASPSWEKVMNDTSKVLAGETVSSAEYELIRPDGSRLFVEVTANPIFRDGTVRAIAAIGRDVTERKMAEEAAEESRQQLADIIDFLPDATLVIDNDGIVIAWNRAMEEMTGIAAKDMLGKGNYEYALPFYGERRPILIDLVLREDDDIESKYVTVERGERVIQGEAYMPALRGGEVYLLGTASALRDRNGAFVGAIETIHDITERRHAEELYLTLATSAQVGVYIVQNGSFVFMNPHIVRYSGFSEDELIGKRSLAFVHPEDRAKVKEQAGESLRRQHASPYEYRIVDKSGSVRWLMETVSAIHYRGKPAVLGNTMDITERKHVEQALQESEEKYRLVVEHAGEAIYIAQDNVLKFANHQTTELIGYSEEELATIPFVNHIHPDDRSLVASMHEKRLRGEPAPAAYSFRSINRNGDPHWVSLNAVLVEWEGKPATLNFAQDITFQKNMEAQLLRSQKMEAVGTLAGGIAHDFNNLLMGIQGYASLMLLDTATTHPHREKLKSIEQLVQSGADLTRQLLGFSRGGRYETKPTNLNETIEKTSRMFGRTKKEISIFTKYEKELRSVEVDPGQIEQVLMNLYVNAWQAMPGGGTLFLETQNVVLDEYDAMGRDIMPGEFVKIAVTDTGVGMDPQTMERIFDPFFTTKEMGRGTGLGLATVYGIVKGHKGIITVTSEKGKGTTFNIYLPVSAKAVPEQKEIQEEILRGKETILIIDDEEAVVATTKEMLENLGYRVMTARSGTEAIEIYKAGRDEIDLVMLDMIMPEMNGGETFDHLKRINPDIKTILSSGYSIDGQAQAILDRGCLAFLQKPFTMHILSQKVRQVLDLAT